MNGYQRLQIDHLEKQLMQVFFALSNIVDIDDEEKASLLKASRAIMEAREALKESMKNSLPA